MFHSFIFRYKERLMIRVFVLLITIFSSIKIYAGGSTNWVTPTRIDLERGRGMMVYGLFGNPSDCTIPNQIYVNSDHPDYDRIYSMILAAYMSGKKISAYSHSCDSVGWYSSTNVTYNIIQQNSAVYIKD